KCDRTPPREDRVSPTKKGKTNERQEQCRRSPQGLALMAKQARHRAEAGEITGIIARHPRATTVLLAVLHMAATGKIIAALSRERS
ncbi:hypothetical protein A2U01_0074129, partial [Trifolium medium]|nr:hypothetical protein [Trifolium medium]